MWDKVSSPKNWKVFTAICLIYIDRDRNKSPLYHITSMRIIRSHIPGKIPNTYIALKHKCNIGYIIWSFSGHNSGPEWEIRVQKGGLDFILIDLYKIVIDEAGFCVQ